MSSPNSNLVRRPLHSPDMHSSSVDGSPEKSGSPKKSPSKVSFRRDTERSKVPDPSDDSSTSFSDKESEKDFEIVQQENLQHHYDTRQRKNRSPPLILNEAASGPEKTLIHTETSKLKKEKSKDGNVSTFYFFGLLIIILLIVAIIFGLKPFYMPPTVANFDLDKFIGDLNEISAKYNQPKSGFTRIRSALKATLNKTEPAHPAVLLFIADLAAHQLLDEVAYAVARAINIRSAQNSESLNQQLNIFEPNQVGNDDSLDVSTKLADFIRKSLASSPNSLVVLKNVERLPGSAPVKLHAFCDNSNAPFKKSAFILTALCPVKSDDERDWDEIGEKCLKKAWAANGLVNDMIAPLLSRVANSVVLVQ